MKKLIIYKKRCTFARFLKDSV
jgi:hypothetical protein